MVNTNRIGWGAALGALFLALGCSGADGAAGANGAQGTQGLPGEAGAPGEKGAPGAAGTNGAKGDQGDPGAQGPAGEAGVVPALVNDVTGTVNDGTNALAGVTVTASPGGATATTDSSGNFTLSALPLGAYQLTFSLATYFDKTVDVAVALGSAPSITISLAMDMDAAAPPTVTMPGAVYNAGYNQAVSLQATATGTGTLTYAWTQTGGPTATLTGKTTATLGFTTQDFAAAVGPVTEENARFGVLGINPDKALSYTFQLVVTDGNGKKTTSTVTVNATRPTTGLRNVPIGVPVWLQGDGPLLTPKQTTWNWTLDASLATGSTATLSDAATQFPHFTPDKLGIYSLTESVSGKSLKVYAGTWVGIQGATAEGACTSCHDGTVAPDMFTGFKQTNHYTAAARKMDDSTGHFGESCMQCHTLGYDKGSTGAKGWTELQPTSGYTFPAHDAPGNWAVLAGNASLGPISGIQCENCHGPQGQPANGPHKTTDIPARVSWSTDVCASCHQKSANHFKPGQWELGGHSNLELAYVDATVETRGTTAAHCGRCHTGQGYAQYVEQLKQGYTGNLTADGKPAGATNAATIASLTALGLTQATVQPQTCVACHDPHDATNPSQLRIYDGVAGLPNGQTNISGMGAGMICATCHNSRNGEHTDFVAAPTSVASPHEAAQTDVVFGFNAYYVPRYTISKHMAVQDSCAGCHYAAVTASNVAAKQTSNHSFVVDDTICSNCHSDLVDGKAMQAGYQAQLDNIGTVYAAKTLKLIQAAIAGTAPFAAPTAITVRPWDAATDYYSSASASNVVLAVAPTSVALEAPIHGSPGLTINLPAAITVPWVDATGLAKGSSSLSVLHIQLGSLKINNPGTASIYASTPTPADYYKVIWNYYLLENDKTKGIHNPGFYDLVLGATTSKLNSL